MSVARDNVTVADLGGPMQEHLTESRIGEGPGRAFQGLVIGLVLGIMLWSIAVLIWIAL